MAFILLVEYHFILLKFKIGSKEGRLISCLNSGPLAQFMSSIFSDLISHSGSNCLPFVSERPKAKLFLLDNL